MELLIGIKVCTDKSLKEWRTTRRRKKGKKFLSISLEVGCQFFKDLDRSYRFFNSKFFGNNWFFGLDHLASIVSSSSSPPSVMVLTINILLSWSRGRLEQLYFFSQWSWSRKHPLLPWQHLEQSFPSSYNPSSGLFLGCFHLLICSLEERVSLT